MVSDEWNAFWCLFFQNKNSGNFGEIMSRCFRISGSLSGLQEMSSGSQ